MGDREQVATGEEARSILVADDDDRVRRSVGRALRHRGYEVIQAADGVEALEAAERSIPSMAIIDLRMPRKDGFEVVAELKKDHAAELPVLVLSGMDGPEDRVRAFDVGADDFVAKPVYIPELLRRVDAFERTRKAYVAVRKANEEADQLRLFAAEAAALLAHDLKNGLSIAIANLQYVEECSEAEGEVLEAFAATTRALRRMSGLVRNFVDIGRLEDAAIKPERMPVDIQELLQNAAAIHDAGAAHASYHVQISCAPELRANVDPVLTERIIHNLLGNAVRYVNDSGHIRLRARLEPNEVGASELVLDISNTGSGVAPEKRTSLFEKYATGGDRKSKRGMGLYFCRMASEAHGGSIRLESDEEFPTIFAVRFGL